MIGLELDSASHLINNELPKFSSYNRSGSMVNIGVSKNI